MSAIDLADIFAMREFGSHGHDTFPIGWHVAGKAFVELERAKFLAVLDLAEAELKRRARPAGDVGWDFAELLPAHVGLPWSMSAEQPGLVLVASGDPLLQVDPQTQMDDAEALSVATAIVLAVNTCAGFAAAYSGLDPANVEWVPIASGLGAAA